MGFEQLRANDAHKRCEPGCSLGCVRMISHTLGEPLKTFGASLKLALGMSKVLAPLSRIRGRQRTKEKASAREPVAA